MLVLSLDTTTRAGSVAVVDDGRVTLELRGDPATTHGQRLPGELMRALEAAAVRLQDVDLFAVAAGPGSFTGLRVGIATIQGLAFALGRRVLAVPALDALARAGAIGTTPVAAWMDAQRGQVFAALYDPSGSRVLIAATALPPSDTVAAWAGVRPSGRIRFVGDGAVRYAGIIAEQMGLDAEVVEPPPLAGLIGQIAAASPHLSVLPHAIVPVYIRRPDAELARLKQSGVGADKGLETRGD